MQTIVKARERAAADSIPDLLGMFGREVRFYREIAPEVGVRVPRCFEALESPEGCRLVLEDLSSWSEDVDPRLVAEHLGGMHRRWEGVAAARWPWLRRSDDAAELIGQLYDRVAREVAGRSDVEGSVREAALGLVGRVAELERRENEPVRPTLIHGDASLRNVRASAGEIAFLDWEDVRLADGAVDLAWLLVSSVEADLWDDVIEAYGTLEGERLLAAMPAAVAQGVLVLGECVEGSIEAAGWVRRLARPSGLVA